MKLLDILRIRIVDHNYDGTHKKQARQPRTQVQTEARTPTVYEQDEEPADPSYRSGMH